MYGEGFKAERTTKKRQLCVRPRKVKVKRNKKVKSNKATSKKKVVKQSAGKKKNVDIFSF